MLPVTSAWPPTSPPFSSDLAAASAWAPHSQPFVVNAFYTGGTGARPGKDGLSCTAFPSGVRSTPVEIFENAAPLIVWQKEFRPDSAGDGEFRGGFGQIMAFAHADGEAFMVSKMFDRVHHAPRGLEGGGDGQPARVFERAADGSENILKGMGRETISEGGTMVLETAGGAGREAIGTRDGGTTGARGGTMRECVRAAGGCAGAAG